MNDVPSQALRDALRADIERSDSDGGCLDAATLAAWSDDALDARQRAAAERHASRCERCQALLAVMIRTTPVVDREPAPWWRTRGFRWAIPIAAGAMIVALSVAVMPRARRAASPPAETTTVADNGVQPLAAPPPAPPAHEPQLSDRRRRRDIIEAPSKPSGAVAATAEKRAPVEAAKEAPAPLAAAPPAPMAAPPPPPAAPDASAQAVARAKAAAAATPSVSSGRAAARMEAFADVQPKPAGLEVLSPDPNVRWLLTTAGRVARSSDRGATWEMQSTGLAQVTAGAAPSADVLWVVGRDGGVALSTDGRTWRRIPFPESVDLTSVHATDAGSAVVRTATGRMFTTVDGGNSWR